MRGKSIWSAAIALAMSSGMSAGSLLYAPAIRSERINAGERQRRRQVTIRRFYGVYATRAGKPGTTAQDKRRALKAKRK